MTLRALLFGSIGTVIETSELQREAFNEAFAQHGLDWHWDQPEYREMLVASGGADRVARYAEDKGESVDAAAIHATKTGLFQQALRARAHTLRPGVAEVLAAARSEGVPVGFVTTTEAETVKAIATAVTLQTGQGLELMTWRDAARPGKPDPAVYVHALEQLGVAASEAVAIEDNADGVAAARAAGLFTIGFPGENTRAADLAQADVVTDADLAGAVQSAWHGDLRAAG